MLVDRFERVIDYIRISVTDRCNLHCLYCVDGDSSYFPHEEILTYEEILRIIRIFSELGVRKVRLTGGEPLVRKNLLFLIKEISKIPSIKDISLTTNGVLLKDYAQALRDAGLRRINVSLDSLKRERFRSITGFDLFDEVIRGIEASLMAGLSPVKINTVIIRGFNEDEILDFVRFAIQKKVNVRFIELMPFGLLWEKERIIPSEEIKARIEEIYPLEETENKGNGPARVFRIKGKEAEIGFISPMSSHICSLCNRIRITSKGGLKPCLFSEKEYDIKKLLRYSASDEEIKGYIKEVIKEKPEKKPMVGFIKKCQKMRDIGG